MKKQLEDNTTSSKQWYYKQEDGRHQFIRGPFTRQEILEILEKGIINKNTLIRHSSGYWYPAFRYLSNSPIYQKIGESTVDDSNKKEETKQDNQAWQALKSKIQWDNLKKEKKGIPILSSTGCYYRVSSGGCIYCSIPNNKYSLIDPKKYWKTISYLNNTVNADFFWDVSDTFTSNIQWLEELARNKVILVTLETKI